MTTHPLWLRRFCSLLIAIFDRRIERLLLRALLWMVQR